jgi:DNA helicase MCM9
MRSVMTTGIGTTSAGLTVAAFKDGNEWILEAGALVLADCGVCCIDEFALIKPEDRGSVHEAMEQQTLSIAKAGLVCKINARATILAATNPSNTNRIDMNYNNNQNTGIASSLLSRFDLIFIMKDEHLTEYDQAHANFKLSMVSLLLTVV